jgi:hypothetical protein
MEYFYGKVYGEIETPTPLYFSLHMTFLNYLALCFRRILRYYTA